MLLNIVITGNVTNEYLIIGTGDHNKQKTLFAEYKLPRKGICFWTIR